jgi:Flp pilus assembly protein TadD
MAASGAPDELLAAPTAPGEPENTAVPPVPGEPIYGAASDEELPGESADAALAVPPWDAAIAEPPPTVCTESPWEAPAAEALPLAAVESAWEPPVASVLRTSGEQGTAPPEPDVVEEPDAPAGPFRNGVRTIWYVALGILLLASFVFTVVGTKARVEDRFPDRAQWPPFGTLNGMDWMNDAQLQLCFNGNQTCGTIIYKFEREALDWLRQHVDGAPVVADDPHDYYRESGGMVATYTGLPILYGPQHEGEQRYDWQTSERSNDATEFFRTDSVDRARILIAKYDIAYIYVGQVARISRRDLPGAISKFDDMAQAGLLEIAYKNTAVTIYHVKQAAGQLGGEPGKPRPSPTPKPTPTEPPLGTDPRLIALEAAVEQNPTDAAARLELATYYREHQNYSRAVEQYREVLKLSPRDVATYQALGDTLLQMGDADAALAAWEEAVKQVPDNPDAHNKVGIAYAARGRYDDAVREFTETVRLNPKFVEASFHLGEVYETLQQKDKAIAAYQAVIANGGDTDWVRQAQTRIDALK